MVTTRETQETQRLPGNCTRRTSLTCKFPPLASEDDTNTFFMAGIEDFSLMIDHTLVVSAFNISKPSYNMHGSLSGTNRTWPQGDAPTSLTRNVLTIRELLAAAGVNDLDDFGALARARRCGVFRAARQC